jgi:hypothetical protein
MAAGVKPRSREAVRLFPQGFTHDGSPGEYGCGVLGVSVERDCERKSSNWKNKSKRCERLAVFRD